jgi:hypothetical protein
MYVQYGFSYLILTRPKLTVYLSINVKVHLEIKKKAGRRGELATYTQTEDITEGNLTRDKDDSLCLLAVCTVSSCIYTASMRMSKKTEKSEEWCGRMSQSNVWYEST